MLQDSITALRSQFIGLNRILSTLSTLVTDSDDLVDENAIVRNSLDLLIGNHNLACATVHLYQQDKLILNHAKSTLSLLRGDIDETQSDWVSTCSLLAEQHAANSDDMVVSRNVLDSIYYSMPLQYHGQKLGYLVVSSPSVDENHKKFLPMFVSMLTSLMMSKRQQVRLTKDVEQRSAELESAWNIAKTSEEAKSRFLSNVSHEYLTPINVINNAASLLSDASLNQEQKSALNSIVESARKLGEMVGGTLDYVHENSDTLGTQVTRSASSVIRVQDNEGVSLVELVKEVYTHALDINENQSIEFDLKLDSRLPLVDVDQQRLRQILSQLLANAIKFTPKGRVWVEVKVIGLEGRLAEIGFSVADSGIGIEESDQQKIFTAFHQLNSSLTRPFEGTGLGLALCQRLAKTLGSEIKVKSQLGKGAVFSFDMKMTISEFTSYAQSLSSPGQPSVTVASFQSEELRGAHADAENKAAIDVCVLLVEDNIINQKLAARLLEKMGCQVDIANDGVDAVDKFSQSKYDLVFMDCQMPNMDGFEATSRIRELENDTRTPIIALTANTLPEDRAKSFHAGMDEFLTKPVAKEQLKQAIHRWSS